MGIDCVPLLQYTLIRELVYVSLDGGEQLIITSCLMVL
jgi:hypothetical protein